MRWCGTLRRDAACAPQLVVMCMYKGEPTQGIEFFKLLYADENFCKELGRAVLATGRLEAELINYLNNKNIKENTKKANLGKLIVYAKKHELLGKVVPALEMIKDQRNYLAHNIYALFSGLIEETILERNDLLDSDVYTYTERAWQLKENINGLADIVEKENENT
jgi:hypothetical protein